MAKNIIRQNDNESYNYTELVCDTLEDVAQLDSSYAVGSICFCIENSSVHMLGGDLLWHEI